MPSSFHAYRNGGEHGGTVPCVVWNVVTAHIDSALNTFEFLNNSGHCPHYIWDPVTGELINPIDTAHAGSMFDPQVNHGGRPLIQIGVVHSRDTPFTDTILCGFEILTETFKSLGIPSVWPKGPPALESYSEALWRGVNQSGHYAINQLTGDWAGIGNIDTRRLAYE